MTIHREATMLALGLAALCSSYTAANAQDLKPDPKNGYTQRQALALFPRFDKATWNLDDDYEFSRFAYLNTPSFFPTAIIHRAGADCQPKVCPQPRTWHDQGQNCCGRVDVG